MNIGLGIWLMKRRGGGAFSFAVGEAPSGLTLTVDSATQISGTFTINASDYDGNYVYFSSNGVDFSLDQTLVGADNTFEKSGLTAGNTYYFYVTTYKGSTESEATDTIKRTISTLFNNIVFAQEWDGSQFINAVTGLALINNGTATRSDPLTDNGADVVSLIGASSQYLSTPDTAALSIGNNDATIAVWVNVTDVSATQVLLGQYYTISAKRAWQIQTYTSLFRFLASANGTSTVITDFAAISNTTYLLLAWHDSTADTINFQWREAIGSIDSIAIAGTGVYDSDADITTGATANPSDYSTARITWMMWKRLLTANEKLQVFSQNLGVKYPFNFALSGFDVFLIAGQSNASGRGTNNQTFTKTGDYASYMFGNNYYLTEIADPVDSNTSQQDAVSSDASAAGSIWPIIATSLSANGRKTVFVPCALGGSSITDWQPGADHQDRSTLYGSMIYRALRMTLIDGTLRAVLMWHGESDAVADMAQATYNGYIDTFSNTVNSDLGIPVMQCKLHDLTPDASNTKINAAIAEAWSDNDNMIQGPDLSGIVQDGSYHIKGDAKLAQVAALWVTAINTAFGW